MHRDGLDPVPELARRREDEGVFRVSTPMGVPVWLVTRPHDVRQVLSDATRFSNRAALRGLPEPEDERERQRARAGLLLVLDPPEHSRLRRMLTPVTSAADTVGEVEQLLRTRHGGTPPAGPVVAARCTAPPSEGQQRPADHDHGVGDRCRVPPRGLSPTSGAASTIAPRTASRACPPGLRSAMPADAARPGAVPRAGQRRRRGVVQAMHVSTAGRASSRSSAMAAPHRTHRP